MKLLKTVVVFLAGFAVIWMLGAALYAHADKLEEHMKLNPFGQCVQRAHLQGDGMIFYNRLIGKKNTKGEQATIEDVINGKVVIDVEDDGTVVTNKGIRFNSSRDARYYLAQAQKGYDYIKAFIEDQGMTPPISGGLLNHLKGIMMTNCRAATLEDKEYITPDTYSDVRFIKVQSEDLEKHPRNYWGFENRIHGCQTVMGPTFQRCKDAFPQPENLYSEAQVRKHLKALSIKCNSDAVDAYYECLGPRPYPKDKVTCF